MHIGVPQPLTYVTSHVYPAVRALLPGALWRREQDTFAFLTAIALQESGLKTRRQYLGPARSFVQFEVNGVSAVMRHRDSRPFIAPLLTALGYPVDLAPAEVHAAVEHNDVLAFALARLLLWTDPRPLPTRDRPNDAWLQYLATWRPGKPHPERWAANWTRAWEITA